MQKLVDLIVEKTGISQEQAQTAVQTIVDHIKSKLPPMLASKVDGLIEGDGGEVENMAKGFLGNLFGPK
jgi:hypothetical protein